MKEAARILVVDDETSMRESVRDWLSDAGYEVSVAENGLEALEIARREEPAIVFADLIMPAMDGIELTKKLKELYPNIAVVIITAYGSIPTAIAAMKEGAYDYIEKPFCPERVELLIEKMAEHQELIKENVSLRQKLEDRYRFQNIIAKSHTMQQLFEVVRTVAGSNATALITGETGTGKELIARAIHDLSHRRDKPFVAVSCAALPESLLESELFGHEKGAFTGAIAQKKGKFEYANKGILFLDEVGEMSSNVQVHLLRAIEEKEITRVGGNDPVKVDVRILSATNKDLRKAVDEGEFRDDLYYRLNVVAINLPPLRQRTEDIPLLAEHFLNKFSLENQKEATSFSTEAKGFLVKYNWPGNVRELENAIERAVILAKDNTITLDDLCYQDVAPAYSTAASKSLKELERHHIMHTLDGTQGNFARAARILGISRVTLYNKVKEYGLSVSKVNTK
ncbi:MAG: sigma-54-dependent Fis family transcriptional regulator [Dehalococcoidia bacterium]|nr:sigma-54-dependent Fis family transcriptional regulator [Dehalococcoidia bacterium]